MDNDAAFCGGYQLPRVPGACVRPYLYVGIEPNFIPFREPECNEQVERLHGLWNQVVWNQCRLRGFAQVQRTQPHFQAWNDTHEAWPTTPRPAGYRALTALQAAALPEALSITASRIHLLRWVTPDGTIQLLKEVWCLPPRLEGHYVWVTLVTHEQHLRIYYQLATDRPMRLVKEYPWPLSEPVQPVHLGFQRPLRWRRMSTMLCALHKNTCSRIVDTML